MKKIDGLHQAPESGVSKQEDIQKATWPIILMTLIGWQGKQIDNFSEGNYQQVNIGKKHYARKFFKINVDQMYEQHHFPNMFYIKTKDGTIYKMFHRDSSYLYNIVQDRNKTDAIHSWPTEWCLYNPQDTSIIGVENPIVRCWEVYKWSSYFTTAPVTEIVWMEVMSSSTIRLPNFKSTIEQEYKQQKKK